MAEAAGRRRLRLGQRNRRCREHLEELREPILRFALLAPDIVEAILVGDADPALMLEKLERAVADELERAAATDP